MTLNASTRTFISFVGAFLLAALLVVPSFWIFMQIKGAASARRHAYEVIVHADNLLTALSDAETGQRGYALTGDEAFLKPYLVVHDGVRAQLNGLV